MKNANFTSYSHFINHILDYKISCIMFCSYKCGKFMNDSLKYSEHCNLNIIIPCFHRLPWYLSWQRIRLLCGRPGFSPWVGTIPCLLATHSSILVWRIHTDRSSKRDEEQLSAACIHIL